MWALVITSNVQYIRVEVLLFNGTFPQVFTGHDRWTLEARRILLLQFITIPTMLCEKHVHVSECSNMWDAYHMIHRGFAAIYLCLREAASGL